MYLDERERPFLLCFIGGFLILAGASEFCFEPAFFVI